MDQKIKEITKTEIFREQSETNKILFILYDYPNSISKMVAEVLLGSEVCEVSEFKPNNPNNPNTLTEQISLYQNKRLPELFKRLMNKQLIQRDESQRPYLYSLSEKGKEEVENKYNDWYEEFLEKTEKKRNEEDIGERIASFEEYLQEKEITQKIAVSNPSLDIDIKHLAEFNPKLAELLVDDFDNTNKCLQIAFEKLDFNKKLKFKYTNLFSTEKRTANKLRLSDVNKLISVVGELDDKGRTQFLVNSAKFECPSCGNVINVLQLENKFKEPSQCGCGRKGKFRLISKDMTDTLSLTIRDLYENISLDQGIEPIKAIMNYEFEAFETLNQGDKIEVVGVLRDIPIHTRTGGISTTRDKLLECYNIKKLNKFYTDYEILDHDNDTLKEISKDPFNWIKDKFFSDLYNVDLQAQACMVGLFGGLHIILLGKPGVGKSTIAKRMAKLSLKGAFVDVVKASPSGVIGTTSKNPFTGKYSLDGGTLKQLHPYGLVVVDELDKDNEREIQKALMGVMSDKELNIHKANTRVIYPCNISVWATCNLFNGRSDYDEHKNESENFNILNPLWNRFDLKVYYNNYVDWADNNLMTSILTRNEDEWVPDEKHFELFKKYQLKAKRLNYSIGMEGNKKLASLGENFVRQIDPTASFRVISTMKRILEGVCRLHLRDTPTNQDFQIMTDIVAGLDMERHIFKQSNKEAYCTTRIS